jgi:hypothetical protein
MENVVLQEVIEPAQQQLGFQPSDGARGSAAPGDIANGFSWFHQGREPTSEELSDNLCVEAKQFRRDCSSNGSDSNELVERKQAR